MRSHLVPGTTAKTIALLTSSCPDYVASRTAVASGAADDAAVLLYRSFSNLGYEYVPRLVVGLDRLCTLVV